VFLPVFRIPIDRLPLLIGATVVEAGIENSNTTTTVTNTTTSTNTQHVKVHKHDILYDVSNDNHVDEHEGNLSFMKIIQKTISECLNYGDKNHDKIAEGIYDEISIVGGGFLRL
jgi:hypothetical protein